MEHTQHLDSSIHKLYGDPIPGSLFQCGDIVQRNHLGWQSGNEDGGAGTRGIVYRIEGQSIYVTWKDGTTSRYDVRELEKVSRARHIHVGDMVVRGRDWIHGEQDGGNGQIGVVTKFGQDGREVFVLWPNRSQANYRWGFAHDVRVVKSVYGIDGGEEGYEEDDGEIDYGGPDPSCSILPFPRGGSSDGSFHIHTYCNNPTSSWAAGDFVVRGPFWRDGGNDDGGVGGVGVVQGTEGSVATSSLKIRVRWQNSGIVGTYGPPALSLVLPGCTEKSRVSFKHRMSRIVEVPRGTTTASFYCRYCRIALIPLNSLRPPFHCPDCSSSICLACYHTRCKPKVMFIDKPGISLEDTRLLFMANTHAATQQQVDFYLEMTDGALQEAVRLYRSDPPAGSAPLPPESSPKLPSGIGSSHRNGGRSPAGSANTSGANTPTGARSRSRSPDSSIKSAGSYQPTQIVMPPNTPGGGSSVSSARSLLEGMDADADPIGMQLTALVLSGNLQELQRVVTAGTLDVNTRGINKSPAIVVACSHGGKKDIVEFLLTCSGCDVNLADSDGDTALGLATDEGNMEILTMLIARSELQFIQNNNGFTALHKAARIKQEQLSLAVMTLLLEHPAGLAAISVPDRNKLTALHHAVGGASCEDHPLVARLLASSGADLFAMTINNFHPLSEAVYKGSIESTRLLLEEPYRSAKHPESGLLQYEIGDENGSTPLHLAASFDWVVILNMLLDAGADIDQRCAKQLTPLMKAVRRTVSNGRNGQPSPNAAFALIDRGADIHALESDADGILHVAASTGMPSVVRRLCELGINVDSQNSRGMTPMHRAVMQGRKGTTKEDTENCMAVIRILVEFGANLEAGDVDQETPLCIACGQTSAAVVSCLIELGASVNARFNQTKRENANRTPLMKASINGKCDIISVLLEHGASPLDQDGDGDDAVQYAIGGSDEHHEAVRVLLTAPDASPFMANAKGMTALHRAASKGLIKSLCYFLDHATLTISPSNINMQDNSGDTALMDAARRGQVEAVRLLVERGADPYLRNHNNKDALDLVSKGNKGNNTDDQSAAACTTILADASSIAAKYQASRLAEEQSAMERFKHDSSDIIAEFRREGLRHASFEKWLYATFSTLQKLSSQVQGLPLYMISDLPKRLQEESLKGVAANGGPTLSLLEELTVIRVFTEIVRKAGQPPLPSPSIVSLASLPSPSIVSLASLPSPSIVSLASEPPVLVRNQPPAASSSGAATSRPIGTLESIRYAKVSDDGEQGVAPIASDPTITSISISSTSSSTTSSGDSSVRSNVSALTDPTYGYTNTSSSVGNRLHETTVLPLSPSPTASVGSGGTRSVPPLVPIAESADAHTQNLLLSRLGLAGAGAATAAAGVVGGTSTGGSTAQSQGTPPPGHPSSNPMYPGGALRIDTLQLLERLGLDSPEGSGGPSSIASSAGAGPVTVTAPSIAVPGLKDGHKQGWYRGVGASRVPSLSSVASSRSSPRLLTVPWEELRVDIGGGGAAAAAGAPGADASHKAILGKGASGTVIKANWRHGKRQIGVVAVKIITRTATTAKGFPYDAAVDAVKGEFQLLSDTHARAINKECIIQALALVQGRIPLALAQALPGHVNENEEAVGIIMRYEGGGSLDAWLHGSASEPHRRAMDSSLKLNILKQIAAGIEELHSLGVVHGDLKPANILLSAHNPPCVRIADFGLSKVRDQLNHAATTAHGPGGLGGLGGVSSAFTDSVRHTHQSHFEGTKLYSAPEMLPSMDLLEDLDDEEDEESGGGLDDGDDDGDGDADEYGAQGAGRSKQRRGSVAVASRKTDVYAFALIMWEVLVRKKPYEDLIKKALRAGGEGNPQLVIGALIRHIRKGKKPSLDQLPSDIPREELREMISRCWDNDRATRLNAYTCNKILDQAHSRIAGKRFDIFFSYRWSHQKFALHLVRMLQESGFRVWFDLREMQHDMNDSMSTGVGTSTVFLCLLSKSYQESKNCKFEIQKAVELGKPVITVVCDPDPFSWVTPEIKTQTAIETHKFVDMSAIVGDPDGRWEIGSSLGPVAATASGGPSAGPPTPTRTEKPPSAAVASALSSLVSESYGLEALLLGVCQQSKNFDVAEIMCTTIKPEDPSPN